MTSANASDILGNNSTKYEGDGSSGTLTLTDATITGMYNYFIMSGGYQLYANIYANNIDLTIELVGTNTVGDSSAYGGIVVEGVSGLITFEGEGGVTAEGITNGISNDQGCITVKSGSVKGIGDNNGKGIQAKGIYVNGGTLIAEVTSGIAIYGSNIGISFADGIGIFSPNNGYIGKDINNHFVVMTEDRIPAKNAAIGHTHDNILFLSWTSNDSLPTGGNYFLTTDVSVSTKTVIKGTLNLCLNGHSIIFNVSGSSDSLPAAFGVGNGVDKGILNLYDDPGKVGKIQGASHAVRISKGTFNMYGGKITQCNATAVIFDGDHNTFNMYGGEISNNKFDKSIGIDGTAAGVYVGKNGTFNMEGGVITGNDVGIFVDSSSEFHLKSSSITGNTVADVELNDISTAANNVIYIDHTLTQPTKQIKVLKSFYSGETKPVVTGGVFTSGWKNKMTNGGNVADPSGYFTSYSSDYEVTLSDDAEAQLVHKHNFSYTASGPTITAKCSTNGCTIPNEHTVTLTLSAINATYTGSVYTGASLSDTTAWTDAGLTVPTIEYAGRGDTSYTKIEAAPTDAGTYTASITVDTDKTATADFTINPVALTITGAMATDRAFDGSTAVTISAVAFKDSSDQPMTLALGENGDYTVTGAISDANAGDSKTVNVTVALKNANYSLAKNTTTATINISKARAQTIADVTSSQDYTLTSVSESVAGKMPDDAGTLTYTVGTARKPGSVTVSDFAVDAVSGAVTAALSGGAVGDTVTLPVIIGSTNYADSTVNVIITLAAKDDAGQSEEQIVEYTFISGTQYTWTKSNGITLPFHITATTNDSDSYDKLMSVEVDGNTTEECKKSRGSVIIELKPTYLETLSVGEHKFRAVFKNGKADTTFTILEPVVNPDSLPQTGDNERPVGYLVMALVALAVLGLIAKKRK